MGDLDQVLVIVLLIITLIILARSYQHSVVAFATIQEFIASCTIIFVKHTFDVHSRWVGISPAFNIRAQQVLAPSGHA